MGDVIALIIGLIIFSFGFVLLFGPPYVPALGEQVTIALDLLDLSKGETMLELGSGDGRVLKAAAERGWKVVGYELNPVLVIISMINTRHYRKQVKIVWGNFWSKKWPEAEGIFTFMIARQMKKLDSKIDKLPNRPIRLASFAFKIPDKKVVKHEKGIYLYEYR